MVHDRSFPAPALTRRAPTDSAITRGPSLLVGASVPLHAGALLTMAVVPHAWPWALGAIGVNQTALTLCGLRPRDRLLGPNMSRLPEAAAQRGEIALTFDDGPDPAVTPAVLDLLDRVSARASFFCVGRRAARYPDLVREIARRGHRVENHTYSHPYAFAFYAGAALSGEIARTQHLLASITGRAPAFFRAPMGFRNPLMPGAMRRFGLRYTSWTRRGHDAVDGDPKAVLRRLTRGLSAGDVLLLHDAGTARTRYGRPVVLEVLPALLDRIAERRLRAVSLTAEAGTPREQAREPECRAHHQPRMHPGQPGVVASVAEM
jgi:peptidoglycan/xylan/chitin deacetylase (PgdA/CDA1 family)